MKRCNRWCMVPRLQARDGRLGRSYATGQRLLREVVIHPEPDHLACDLFVRLESNQLSLVFGTLSGTTATRLPGGLSYGTGAWHVARLAELLTWRYKLREHRDRQLGEGGEAAHSSAD